MSFFGTSGIRGDAKNFLTGQFCFDIGRAFAIFLERSGAEGLIAIGMDPRESSQRIKEAFSAGLQNEGREVFDEGICSAPAINYILITDSNFAGSVMITGSHIRSDFNGIKFFCFKKEILKNQEKEIEEIYGEVKEKIAFEEKIVGIIQEDRANETYKKMLFDLAELPYPKWKVVLDLGNGSQSKTMPELFKELGVETVIMNNDPEPGKFIARDTEVEEAVDELKKKVGEEKADLGIGFDGDGDRAVFIDNEGNFIPGDYTGALVAKYGDTPIIIVPINASQVVEHLGKPVIRTKVGSPFVVEAMEKNNATFGFESNGGGISKDIMLSRDAGSMAVKILNLLKKTEKTLKELVSTLPKFYIFRTKVDCKTEFNSIILKKAKEEFKGVKIEEIDGLKIWQDDTSWILFRPSHNAPEFRVFAEAKSKEKAEELGNKGIQFVKKIAEVCVS